MRVVLKRLDPERVRNMQGIPSLRALSVSALIHGAVFALLLSVSPSSVLSIPHEQTVYTQFIAPKQKQIVWYRLHELPLLTTPPDIVRSSATSGRMKSPDAIISRSTNGKQTKQVVIQSETAVTLKQKVSAPNLIAVEAQNHNQSAPKTFVPPSRRSEFVRAPQVPAPPDIPMAESLGGTSLLQRSLTSPQRITRRFVPPPVHRVVTPAPRDVTVPSAPTLDRAPAGSSTALADIVERSGQPRIVKRFVLPRSGGGRGNSPRGVEIPEPDTALGGDVTAAILSTNPTRDLISILPPGNRRGDMSQAPKVGAPASHGTPDSSVSGLLIQPGNRPTPEQPQSQARIEYQETDIAALRRTFSAPLRSSSRTIPRTIEDRFHDRIVYTMIVPKPKLAMYAGDWVIWFAEREPRPDTTPQIRSPLPVRKITPLTDVKLPSSGRAYLGAVISKTGRVEAVQWRGRGTPDGAAIDDLLGWQFLPALRDGEPIDVEIIIDIPFR